MGPTGSYSHNIIRIVLRKKMFCHQFMSIFHSRAFSREVSHAETSTSVSLGENVTLHQRVETGVSHADTNDVSRQECQWKVRQLSNFMFIYRLFAEIALDCQLLLVGTKCLAFYTLT